MIGLPLGTRVWIAAGVTDMRRGMDSLAALVQTALGEQPFSGDVFVFRGRRGDLLKLLWWSGDGMNLYAKRLERGRFVWPQATSGVVHLTGAQLSMLLEGIDWRRPVRTWQPTVAAYQQCDDDVSRDALRACNAPASCGTFAAMARAIDQLPDDVATLKRLLVEREAEVVQRLAELEVQRAEVLVARLLIEKLKLQIARLRRIQFGRRSEQHDARVVQLELIVEELETSLAASPAPAEPSPSSPRTPPVRKPLPATLPRETVVHAAACTCPDCGGALKQIGEDVAEQLEFIPEHFKVIRHVRPKFACGQCSTIVQAAAPSRPIDKGIAGPGLLAHVAVSKYLDHLPLYRQSEIYARQGIDLERSTLADWIGGISRLVTPLAELIGRYVTAATKIHADDTPVPVLDPGRGKTKTGRLWVYVRDDRPAGSTEAPAAFYRYTATREGAHPRAHLKDFRGTLQADGFSGFDGLYVDGRVREAACWAHARRKFYDLHADTRSPLAEQALTRIQHLYAIEAEIRGKSPDERRRVRQARAGPLLEALQQWMLETRAKVSAKSELAGAINYALKRWVALTRYRDDGAVEIDNNAAERALRGPVLSRKNFLFAGADSGGERAAMLYTLLETAKLNGLNPEAYLRFVLERIAEQPSNRLAELLPWNFAPRRVEHEQLAA